MDLVGGLAYRGMKCQKRWNVRNAGKKWEASAMLLRPSPRERTERMCQEKEGSINTFARMPNARIAEGNLIFGILRNRALRKAREKRQIAFQVYKETECVELRFRRGSSTHWTPVKFKANSESLNSLPSWLSYSEISSGMSECFNPNPFNWNEELIKHAGFMPATAFLCGSRQYNNSTQIKQVTLILFERKNPVEELFPVFIWPSGLSVI